ncbi:AMP-binding protein [Aquicoccus sp. SCR17]|nr:AMP-binding protein [Carideicomes alvinocaridis]
MVLCRHGDGDRRGPPAELPRRRGAGRASGRDALRVGGQAAGVAGGHAGRLAGGADRRGAWHPRQRALRPIPAGRQDLRDRRRVIGDPEEHARKGHHQGLRGRGVILDLLAARARDRADAPCVVTDQASYSYAQIHDLSCRLAARLAAEGIGQGDHVAVLAGNSAAYLVSWFGMNALGAVAVTLNDKLKAGDMDYLLSDAGVKLILADREWREGILPALSAEAQAIPCIGIDGDAAFFADLAGHAPVTPVEQRASDPCTILYTSGTTGRPKGVICCHGAYVASGRQAARILELTPEDRVMVFLPLFHTNPQTYAVMSALWTGSALILRPRFSAMSFFEDARRFEATGCTFVGTVLAILAARFREPQREHRMRFCIGGGTTEELAATVEDRFGMFVHELYGMTEMGGWVSGASRAEHRRGSNGRVRDDMEVAILDDDDGSVPPGSRGEIAVRPAAPFVTMLGYHNRPEETVAATRNLWFHTGDIGGFDADGYLYFHGRKKEIIRRGGEMVSPVAIEDKLRDVPGVLDCAAVGVPDDIMGEEIKVLLVTEGALDATALRGHLDAVLPANLLPRYVEFTDHIPRTQTEKILRRDLAYLDERVIDTAARQPGGGR